jgi:hypothetical protein
MDVDRCWDMRMKLLAIIDLKPGSSIETARSEPADEIKGCWEPHIEWVQLRGFANCSILFAAGHSA